jgi:acetylornithine/succinyldiaminopimelate/putrescine aminotransferase
MEAQLPHIASLSQYFLSQLESLRTVPAVRSKGLMYGLQLDRPAYPVVEAALLRGLLINATQDTVLRLLPPYIATKEDADETVRILSEIL